MVIVLPMCLGFQPRSSTRDLSSAFRDPTDQIGHPSLKRLFLLEHLPERLGVIVLTAPRWIRLQSQKRSITSP
jgi:hypothetical protein